MVVLLVVFAAIVGTALSANFLDNDLAKVCRQVDRPLDVLFILDGSGSVGGTTFDTQMKMLNRIIDLVDVGDAKSRIAVMQYSSYPNMEFLFNTYRDKNTMRTAIQNIRPKLGTTKTGKALSKAWHMFHEEASSGSRQGRDNIGQVVILVSDGHSHDDAIPPAIRLRESGVHLIALGIGTHINEGELLQITGDKEFAFNNLSLAESVDQFTSTFKKLAIGERCEFSRGFDGADIVCDADSFRISVTTKDRLHGHLYVQDHFHETRCKWNNTSVPTSQSSEANITLTVGLRDCGVQHQFLMNPKGVLFVSTVVLQFHPTLATSNDKTFKVHCFYHDKSDPNEIDWSMIKEHTQRKSKKEKNSLPCSLRILKDVASAPQQMDFCSADGNSLYLGDKITYKWECNLDNYDTYQSMLVHSCYLIDMVNKQEQVLIDANGCSVEESLLENPQYTNALSVLSRGTAIRKADGPFLRLRCSLKFCDRLMGECEGILPPKCSSKKKRQAGFAVSIKPLGHINDSSALLTFDRSKSEKNKMLLKRRIGADQKVQVSVSHLDDGPKNGVPRREFEQQKFTKLQTFAPLDVKVATQSVRALEKLRSAEETEKEETEENSESEYESGNEEREKQPAIPTEKDTAKAVSEDPFQEEMNKENKAERDDEGLRSSTELDPKIMSSLSAMEFELESEIIYVRDRNPACLRVPSTPHK